MRRLLALLVPLVVLASCVDDGDDAAGGSTTTVLDGTDAAAGSATPSEPAATEEATEVPETAVPLDAPAVDGSGLGAGDGEGMGDAVLAADLDGSGPVPGPGHADATGRFEAELVEGTLCVDMVVSGLDSAVTEAHLHRGPEGEAGPALVDLGPPSSTGDGASTWSEACTDVDDAVIEELAAAPERTHVDVHSRSFPDGAVRGQLSVISIFDRTLA